MTHSFCFTVGVQEYVCVVCVCVCLRVRVWCPCGWCGSECEPHAGRGVRMPMKRSRSMCKRAYDPDGGTVEAELGASPLGVCTVPGTQ